MKTVKKSGLEIVRSKKIFWKESDAEEVSPHIVLLKYKAYPLSRQFYSEHKGRFYFPRLVQHAASGPFLALALYGPSAISSWRTLIGPTHVYKTQWTHPETLRAQYGISDTRNGFHGSDGVESAKEELGKVFEGWDVEWWLQHQLSGEGSEKV
ncbi:hypothetical protein P7C70_g2220, partial [Phenoliferia sp. Uapishka_3]